MSRTLREHDETRESESALVVAPAPAEPAAAQPSAHPAVCGQLEFVRGNYRLIETRDLVL
jgi:hypothetical protein